MRSASRLSILTLLLAFLGISTALNADQTPVSFLRVNADSIISNMPDPGKLAHLHAVWLLHKEDLDISPDYSSITSIHEMVLITSPEGAQLAGTFVIPYQTGYDSVVVNKARTISANGTEFEVQPSGIIRDLIPESLQGMGVYTDQREVHINFDAVGVGSVIESVVSVIRSKPDMPGFAYSAFLSKPATTSLAIVSVRHAADTKLFAKTHLFDEKPIHHQKDGRTSRTWVQRMVPPVSSELAGKPYSDLAVRVDFSSFETWAEFGNTLYASLWSEDLSRLLTRAERAYLNELCKGKTSPAEQLRSLYYGVQDDIRYLGLELGANNWKPYASSEVLTRRFGDCKDKCNLLVKLLRQGGIDAFPAVVTTTNISMNADSSFACHAMLDHAITYVPDCDGREYWLDPTLEYAPLNWSPPYLDGVVAVILDDSSSRLKMIPPGEPKSNSIVSEFAVHVSDDGSAMVAGKSVYTGAFSIFSMKPMVRYTSLSERDEFMQSYLLSNVTAARDFQYSVEGQNSHDSDLILQASFVDGGYAQVAGNLLIVNSGSQPLSSNFDFSNRDSDRATDLVLMGPSYNLKNIEIVPPENYELNFNPPAIVLENKFFDYEMHSVSSSDGTVRMTFEFLLKTNIVQAHEYQKYRSQIEQMDAADKRRPIFQRTN